MRKLLLLTALFPLLTACTATKQKTFPITFHSERNDRQVELTVEVADNDDERITGLQNRTSLIGGMIFVFPKEDTRAFWMRDTKIGLDIMYFDAAGKFINAHTMEPCKEDPCPKYNSASPASYAIEVNKGYREANGIGVGWYIDPNDIAEISDPE